MKNLLILIALITVLMPMTATAQAPDPHSMQAYKEVAPESWNALQQFLNQKHTAGQQKTTGIASRLIANYRGRGTAAGLYQNRDSSFYVFSGGHKGIDLNNNTWVTANGMYLNSDYDTGTNWNWDTSSLVYKPKLRCLNIYTTQGRLKSSLVQNFTGGVWKDSSRNTFYYDNAGNDTLSLAEFWAPLTAVWINSTCRRYTYDAAGNELTSISQNWNTATGAWENITRMTSSYNALNHLISHLQEKWSLSISNWRNYAKDDYVYSTANLTQSITSLTFDTISNTWLNSYQDLYYYNASGQIIASAIRAGSGLSWLNYDSTSYPLLNSSGDALLILGYSWDGASWQLINRFTNTYGTGSEVTVQETWNGTAVTNYYRMFSFYNSYGQLSSNYSEFWNGTTWVTTITSGINRFYYELFTSTLVSPVASAAPGIQACLFPVPASDKITLAVRLADAQTIRANISDASGKLLMQWTGNGSGLYTKDLSLSCLPNGIYYLLLQSATERWQQSFMVQH